MALGVVGGIERAEDGVIVGFGAAAGKENFLGASVNECSDLFTRDFDGGAGFLPDSVNGGSVTEGCGKVREHDIEHSRIDGRGCVVIEIDRRGHCVC